MFYRYALLVFGALAMFATPIQIAAHEGHEHAEKPKTTSDVQNTGLLLPPMEGPKPWSPQPALDDPQRFSIAIMTDRTGGHRPGIWMQAVERINWLRPDFVVSVGDLIEGYSQDRNVIEEQWKEFLGFIEQMEMKFFFVPGNHDVTNPTMHEIWREKFGREWYSFDYRGVHFVCLCSEDPQSKLGEAQLQWLREDLDASKDARWTFLFLHKPLWVYAEAELSAGNPDPTNWKLAEKMLVDRPHTVFAGHVHNYVQYERNGQQYYSLATTGGGSRLRGLPYGEFDHITWLTMESDGPRVANLLLEGIQPANVVTETEGMRFNQFLESVRLQVDPIFVSDNDLQQGKIRLRLRNDYDKPVIIKAQIAGLPLVGLDLQEEKIQIEAKAGEAWEQVVNFQFKEPIDLERFSATTLYASALSVEPNPIQAEWSIPVIIDRQYEIGKATIKIDGRFDDWSGAEWWSTSENPTLAGASENWKGPADGSLKIATQYDESRVYFAAKVADESIVEGDQLVVAIDPRVLLRRLSRNQLDEATIAIIVEPPGEGLGNGDGYSICKALPYNRPEPKPGFEAMGRRVEGGYELEFSVPIDNVHSAQTSEWNSIQLGARLSDVDLADESPVEVLWHASPNLFENREYAHVIRK